MEVIEPKPEFLSLSEEEVVPALNDLDPSNPIACEVARLIGAYTANFVRHTERLGYVPDVLLRLKPRSAIEAVAMKLTSDAIRQTLGRRS